MLSRPSVQADAIRLRKSPSLLRPISISGKSAVLGLGVVELVGKVLLASLLAALALAIVSRRAAEDFGDCMAPDVSGSVDLEEG